MEKFLSLFLRLWTVECGYHIGLYWMDCTGIGILLIVKGLQ